MTSIPGINLRLARKGLSITLALFLCMSAAASGVIAVACEHGGPCLNCLQAKQAADSSMADHAPVSQVCSSNMQGSLCSLETFDPAINRQIAIRGNVIPLSELPSALSTLKVEPESVAAKQSGLTLPSKPQGPTVPIYLLTLAFLC